jgi:hypothetical protein
MPAYRVHYLQKDGGARPGEYFQASDDEAAMELVRLRMEKADCELWRGAQKLAVIPAEGGAPILARDRPSST